MFTVAASNAEVTPFLSANNNCADKQTNNNSKQSSDNSKQTGKQTTEKENNSRQKESTTSATNEDEDFQETSSKIATKKKRVGSKVVSKSTKRAVTMKKSTKSTKSTVPTKKRAVALGKVNARKRGEYSDGSCVFNADILGPRHFLPIPFSRHRIVLGVGRGTFFEEGTMYIFVAIANYTSLFLIISPFFRFSSEEDKWW